MPARITDMHSLASRIRDEGRSFNEVALASDMIILLERLAERGDEEAVAVLTEAPRAPLPATLASLRGEELPVGSLVDVDAGDVHGMFRVQASGRHGERAYVDLVPENPRPR